MTELRPAQQDPQWDPPVADPLQLDDGAWMFEAEREFYARKPGVSRAALAWTFAALVVVLAILAAALLVAAPRETNDATQSRMEGRSGVGVGTEPDRPDMLALSWYPSSQAGVRPRMADSEHRSTRPDATVDVLPDTSTSVSGTATWYCGGGSACTRGYPPGTLAAAAGPALRVGDWRGRIVKVCSGGRCVKVQLVDWCFCGSGRVIDLYRSAFSRLANPSRGLLRVSITWGGSTVVLPPTDTR